MKILFDHPSPFLLAHGGFQIQIEQTKMALEKIGVEIEWLRWWDADQRGDVIHYFGRPGAGYIRFAHQKGMKVVMSELLTGPGSRPVVVRWMQKLLMVLARRFLPRDFTAKLAWDAYRLCDACIALTSWEKYLMIEMFDADPAKVHVIPNGVEEVFFEGSGKLKNGKAERNEWLVCTATITERKRVLELAEAAVIARTPVWIIGKPYSEADPYFLRFLEVSKRSEGIIRYEAGISDRKQMAEIYRLARGFVLLSTMESLSLSALEAAASDCPLLLSDLPWARSTFSGSASYCPISPPCEQAVHLARFYGACAQLPIPEEPARWCDVAKRLKAIYEEFCR